MYDTIVVTGFSLIAIIAAWLLYTKYRNRRAERDGERLHSEITERQEIEKPKTSVQPLQEVVREDQLAELQSRYSKKQKRSDKTESASKDLETHSTLGPKKKALVEELRKVEAEEEIKAEGTVEENGGKT